MPTSAIGFSLGYRVHGNTTIVVAGAVAVAVLALVALWGHDHWDTRFEVTVNVAASILLAIAHWQNFRLVRALHGHQDG